MTNEEKILDILAAMQGQMSSMSDRMDSMEEGLSARIDSVEKGLNGRMDSLDGRMDSLDGRMDSLDDRMDSLDGRMDSLENSILKTNIKLEMDIEVKLDALGDGYAAILEQMVPISRVEKLESDVHMLKAVSGIA